MSRVFALYPEEKHWWSRLDYGHVLDTVRSLGATRILEFGPGSSTLALIEGGATHIDTCEDDPHWAQVYEDRLQAKYQAIVHVRRYVNADPLSIPGIDAERYDLALIDGPRATDERGPAIRYALERCAAVLVPTEDMNRGHRGEIAHIAAEAGWQMVVTDTGPLSGGFALLTPPLDVIDFDRHGFTSGPYQSTYTVPLAQLIATSEPTPYLTRKQRRMAAKKGAS